MTDRIFLVALCVFLLLFGIAAVTNIQVAWMTPITGFAALVAGCVGLFRAFANRP